MRPGPPLLVACLLLLAGCTGAQRPSTFRVATARCEPCRVDALAEQLAGPGAEDCGWARTGAARTRVQACAVRALEAGRPFRALFTEQGIDSLVVHAFVRTAGGELSRLTADSDPGGGLRACRAVVTRTPCARLAPDAQRASLVCEEEGTGRRVCDEQTRLAEATGEVEDARLLACNPLPGEGAKGFCLRLPEPSGNVPPGLQLTCEPFAAEAPHYLVCRPAGDDLVHTR